MQFQVHPKKRRVNPFRTAVPFRGQTSQISSSLSPKRDCGPCGPKRVKKRHTTPSQVSAESQQQQTERFSSKREDSVVRTASSKATIETRESTANTNQHTTGLHLKTCFFHRRRVSAVVPSRGQKQEVVTLQPCLSLSQQTKRKRGIHVCLSPYIVSVVLGQEVGGGGDRGVSERGCFIWRMEATIIGLSKKGPAPGRFPRGPPP